MPIYEFYCQECNTVYNFFSRTVNTEKVPNCPKCKSGPLKRRVSLFAAITGRRDDGDADDGMPPIDESKMEKAMAMLASEADKINEDDPRQAARLMRKLSDATGLKMGPGIEEALSRMERGEDPDAIEQEMGDLLEGEEPFVFEQKSRSTGRKPKPLVDETLYDL
ncbi:MAG: FmdB family zinc ribbon protein [Desulfomonilia bacterium]|jgi:putative FmdB family regulatory protein|uniref:Zinc ribbon domain protein n=1 Tax=anaerobic digester metagenome TaxID=1263854 RepID=A0A485M4X6_9ZZZZ|nr:zinc ribbon domain-containing protein [Pseudomonadota bacterium]HON37168.1 zinc ribbon domain-containing protein [Deltaproteobacteria bacterium]HRS54954.1 zinc ribbon domain-containing protein [Desulfomonilia bacterium]HPD20074.1 zinc ribbon domain-containing protein [Deltaproteobacteria bacterium]HPX17793.1 zinc ribbon domain-containing protein [Deltaproteobacteria bacterium]